MRRGSTSIDGVHHFALPLFAGLRAIAIVLLSRSGSDLACRLTGETLPEGPERFYGRQIELQGLLVRRQVMRACWFLLSAWPEAFRTHLLHEKGRRWWFMFENRKLPQWLQVEVDRLTLNYPPGPPLREKRYPAP